MQMLKLSCGAEGSVKRCQLYVDSCVIQMHFFIVLPFLNINEEIFSFKLMVMW